MHVTTTKNIIKCKGRTFSPEKDKSNDCSSEEEAVSLKSRSNFSAIEGVTLSINCSSIRTTQQISITSTSTQNNPPQINTSTNHPRNLHKDIYNFSSKAIAI